MKKCIMNANVRNEIGSEFALLDEDETKANNVLSYLNEYNVGYYASGRIASLALLDYVKQGKILFPYYVCASVLQPYINNECKIDYYKIKDDFSISDEIYEQLNEDVSAIYIIPYFGKKYDYTKIRIICDQLGILIIEDTTQSIFTSAMQVGDIGICSLRKWFAIPHGGIVYSKKFSFKKGYQDCILENIRYDALKAKQAYLNGDENNYYEQLKIAESMLDASNDLIAMGERSKRLLENIDIDVMVAQRSNNYRYLVSRINNSYIKIMTNSALDCPFMLVVATENQRGLSDWLNSHKIWCPVLWPIANKQVSKDSFAKFMANHSLAIAIDQRYSEVDMERIAVILNEYNGSKN